MISKEGVCPQCQAFLYSETEFATDNGYVRYVTCGSCGWEGKERFTMKFVGHSGPDDEPVVTKENQNDH